MCIKIYIKPQSAKMPDAVGADAVFGAALSEQFAENSDVAAPPVLVRCTTELEKRLQGTGTICYYSIVCFHFVHLPLPNVASYSNEVE